MTSSSEAAAKAPQPKTVPRRLGKYEIQKQIGAGGMGAVYLAKDTELKRLVALKVLPRERAANPTLVKRFKAEAQAAAQLRHENIVAIHDSGEADGHLYIAMEYVDGTDLHEVIRKRGKIPVKRALEIVKQVAAALQHAYQLNIVHRDIKPSNLLIRNDGVVKVTDLGLARSVDDTLETDITRAGTTVGTVDYMSPEQGRSSKSADIRSDIYSLGCTWYHMLTGKPPFPEGSMTNKLQAHAVKLPPDPRSDNEAVTEAMVAVLHRMMAKKPEDRYQTPEELLKDLSRPTLTRGGVADEVYSAISESEDIDQAAKPQKRTPGSGKLPPKKKSAQKEEEDDSFLSWETLQPLMWGGLMLGAIVGLGLVVAKLSGNLDFGSGPVAQQDQTPAAGDSANVVGQQVAGGPMAQSGSSSVVGPDGSLITSADGGPVGPSADTPTTGGSVAAPSTLIGDSNPDADAPNGEAAVAAEGTVPRTFDPEAVPEWSKPPEPSTSQTSGQKTGEGGSVRPSIQNPGSKSPFASTTPTAPRDGQPVGTKPIGRQPGAISPGTGAPGTAHSPNGSPAAGLKAVSVGGHRRTENHFPTLSEALRALPPEGGVVQFTTAGPFRLPRVEFPSARRLVLTAAEGVQPVVLLKPSAGDLTAGLHLTGGLLELEGLHFVADRSVIGSSDPVAMAAVTDGQLSVRRCTFTAWGDGIAPVAALRIGSQLEPNGTFPPLEPRVLIEEVLTRGDHLTALAIARPCANVVVRDSLFVSGSAPVVQLSGKLPESLASAASTLPRRALRFLQSTLFGERTVFEFRADGADLPPSTTVYLQDSICATTPSAESALVDASNWPQSGTAVESGSRLVNLSWRMKNSAALGFHQLAMLGSSSTLQVNDVDGWQTLWNNSFTAAEFPSKPWPVTRIADLAAVSPADFRRETLPSLEVARPDNSPPGCETPRLPNPATVSRRRLSAIAAKPAFPTSTSAADATQVVQIDASKQDLGRELQNGAWPPGAVIEVTGSGVRQMTPVSLVDKSWKIVGKPQEGSLLTFTPKPVATGATALVEAIRGSVELVNLRFQVPATQKSSLQCLIGGHGSQLTLTNVDLQGVMTNSEALDELLHWSADNSSDARLVCQDSTFAGSGRALQLSLGTGPVFLRNCLIVSRGDGLDITIPSAEAGSPAGALSADHLTISATLGAIHLHSDGSESEHHPVHRFYFDQCVFAAPLAARANEPFGPTLFRLARPEDDLKAIEWWGTSNGISSEITTLIRSDKEREETDAKAGWSRWREAWSEEQDTQFLSGPGGVVLAEPNSKSSVVKPAQFALHPSAKASTWGVDGSPIGVDIRRLDAPIAPAAKPKETPKATGKKGPALPDF